MTLSVHCITGWCDALSSRVPVGVFGVNESSKLAINCRHGMVVYFICFIQFISSSSEGMSLVLTSR